MKPLKIHGLRTCIYCVPDLEKAKSWYADVFDCNPYFDEPFYVGFNIGGFELGLLPYEKDDMPKGETVKTYWGVDDIHLQYQRFLKAGASGNEEPHNVGGQIMVATVFDPWANLIGLIFNPEFHLE